MIGFNRKNPIPGLGEALAVLAGFAGFEATAAICGGCLCVTTDLNGC